MEDRNEGLVARAARDLGSAGELLDDAEQVLSGLLPRPLPRLGVLGVCEQLRVGRLVAAAELLGQGGVLLGSVSLDLGQEPLDRHSHQLGATETGHVTEDMGRVEPLAGDVQFQLLSQPDRHVVEDLSSQFVLAKEFLIAFDGACRDRDAGFQVEGVLDVAAEDVSFGGLLGGPAEEVGQEDQASHRVQFLGGGSQLPTEMFGQFAHRHHFEEDVSKDTLPARADDPLTGGRDHALEGVEETVLSWVDDVDHSGRNSFFQDMVKSRVAS